MHKWHPEQQSLPSHVACTCYSVFSAALQIFLTKLHFMPPTQLCMLLADDALAKMRRGLGMHKNAILDEGLCEALLRVVSGEGEKQVPGRQ